MFRALLCSSSGGQIVLYSIWYHHTETSEWSKITKIQFYKYEHIVVKVIYRVRQKNLTIFKLKENEKCTIFLRDFITKIIFISKHFSYNIHLMNIVSVK